MQGKMNRIMLHHWASAISIYEDLRRTALSPLPALVSPRAVTHGIRTPREEHFASPQYIGAARILNYVRLSGRGNLIPAAKDAARK